MVLLNQLKISKYVVASTYKIPCNAQPVKDTPICSCLQPLQSHVYIYTYIHIYIHIYIYIYSYVHTYIHTYIHTCIILYNHQPTSSHLPSPATTSHNRHLRPSKLMAMMRLRLSAMVHALRSPGPWGFRVQRLENHGISPKNKWRFIVGIGVWYEMNLGKIWGNKRNYN